jgi:tRNA (cmo5U34)-methyltransferase
MTRSDNTTPYKAADYDRDVRLTIPFYELIHEQTIDLVKTVKPDVEIWLDAGCGTGRLVELAMPFFPDARFILCDSSEAMLREAGKRFGNQPEHRVELLPPLRNELLGLLGSRMKSHVITSILCNHYLQRDQRVEAVLACYKALQPDGLFVTFENIDTHSTVAAQIGLDRWARYQLEQGRSPMEVEDHKLRFKVDYFPVTIAEHLKLLNRIGFRTAEVFWLSHMQAGLYAIK